VFNYIWAGLIAISFLFAIGQDIADVAKKRYGDGSPLAVTIDRPPVVATDDPVINRRVVVRIDEESFRKHFGLAQLSKKQADAIGSLEGELVGAKNDELRITSKTLPAPLDTMRKVLDSKDAALAGSVQFAAPIEPGASGQATVHFPPVRFVKLNAMTSAAVEFAEKAATVALGLIGGLCLWLGLLKIAEEGGLVNALVKVVQPILRPLFPGIPKDHPALGLISLNVAANMLALGNAATPMGIKAMTELQKLNPTKDTATNAMVMLLAINTAGVTLLPSASLVSLLGTRMNVLMMPIWLATLFSLLIAIATCFLLGNLQTYRRSDPERMPNAQ
jgi:spore maturation protein A